MYFECECACVEIACPLKHDMGQEPTLAERASGRRRHQWKSTHCEPAVTAGWLCCGLCRPS
ncbi:rCG55507 [Rattus norvegicus]|uniref:RCG55507 n=1 Tax=Rattus norvegicus TaxID=10116 RepID=A6JQJ3_RAT|nr:rCG55507 [Rattus norvegicus]